MLFSTMGGSFFLVMFLGMLAGGLGNAQFEERSAVIDSYESQCLPDPSMISAYQPKCVIEGRDGAMLDTVTLTYDAQQGVTKTHFIRYPRSWHTPTVGTRIKIFVDGRDPDRFKLEKDGWISRNY